MIAARDRARAEEAAAGIASDFDVTAASHTCDVATAEGCAKLVRAVRECSAAATSWSTTPAPARTRRSSRRPDEKWQAYWDLHVMAAVRLARGLVPMMAARGGGAILNNASICATAAALVRADLQRDQGRADDAVEEHGDRVHRQGHPRQHHQPRPDPDAGLGQDREAARARAATGRATSSRSPTSTRRSSASAPSRSSPTSSSSSARAAPPTPSAPPTSSTAACSAPSEEGRPCPCPSR